MARGGAVAEKQRRSCPAAAALLGIAVVAFCLRVAGLLRWQRRARAVDAATTVLLAGRHGVAIAAAIVAGVLELVLHTVQARTGCAGVTTSPRQR